MPEGIIRGIAEENKIEAEYWLEKFGKAEMYGFFLFHEEETDLWKFLGENLKYLDDLCGKECHIGIIERSNPDNLPEWYMKEQMYKEPEFWEELSESYQKFLPYDKFNVFSIAKNLGIPLNQVPCIVFFNTIPIKEYIYLPILVDPENYKEFFKDVFTRVQMSLEAPPKKRLKTLNSKLNSDRMKWNVPVRAEKLSGTLNKIVSPVRSVVDVVSPLREMLR